MKSQGEIQKVPLNCFQKLVQYIKSQVDSQGVFRFGFVWTKEYPIETIYIGIEDIPESLHDDYYQFVDDLTSCFGENVMEGEILMENPSVIKLSTTRSSYDPLSKSIELDEDSVLSGKQIEEIIIKDSYVKEHGFKVITIYYDYEVGDPYLDYKISGVTTIANTLFA